MRSCVPLCALLVLARAVDSSVITTGAELAAGLCSGSGDVLRIAGGVLTLADADWAVCGDAPYGLRRNVTLEGANGASGPWPLLQFSARRKYVYLSDHVHLTFHWVVINGYRARDNFVSRPGLDFLAPSPPGTVGAVVVVLATLPISDVCYPPELMRLNLGHVARPPTVPGDQRFEVDVPQPGCLDAVAAGPNLTARCWPMLQQLDDYALAGLDADAADAPQPNNYVFHLINSPTACRVVLTKECIDSLGPIGCFRFGQSDLSLLPPVLPVGTAAASPPGSSGPAPTEAAAGVRVPGPAAGSAESTGDGGGSGPPPAVVAGCVVGAVLLVAVIAGAALVLWRQGARASRGAAYKAADKSASLGADKLGSVWVTSGPTAGQHVGGDEGPASSRGTNQPSAELPVVITLLTPARPCTLRELQVLEAVDTGASPASHASGDASEGGAYSDAPAAVVLTGRVLGKGACGHVLEGVYMGQRVAVKQYQGGGSVVSEVIKRSCVQELEILARCDHPNVVRLLAACVTGPRPVTVMELCDLSLARLLYSAGEGKLLPMALVLHIATEVAKGLEYLHPTIVHRDLKPANVLINNPDSPFPEVKLADFGLSRIWDTVQSTKTPEAGTPPYLAPECFETRNWTLTPKVDIYSWGVCVWEMLTGERPWRDLNPVAIATQVALMERQLPIPWGDHPNRWPPRLQRLLKSTWERDPSRRPAAAELVKELLLLREESSARTTPRTRFAL
ncbi:hypothetical protein HYH03_015664 [Edaphochlamys debaryana]|uniref:Protein kinase domain-containing protein n=1 Tax=Edaphochlamys debaryana TaxID=47281 RepID=A0A835XNV3_9CHLO|nr:hypothetical protein HYH03_015664 [Edaphochlamys debaryana]|eukprot:KAG2485601.1 hypothetical protein HYH03_015664 [Edaphochlamys debaryana]